MTADVYDDASGPEFTEESAGKVPASARYIRFGPFQIDQDLQKVTKHGYRLKLHGKVYQLLIALLGKPGEVVTREELRQRLWPADTLVDFDANVSVVVNKLRQVLGDCYEKPLYIETIRGRGYSFLLPSETCEFPQDSPGPSVPTAAGDDTLAPANSSLRGSKPQRSSVWITTGIIGLIIIAILLGATITQLLISHFSSRLPGSHQTQRQSLVAYNRCPRH
ncbi:MAG TPA: winged helix-turn-helix domain-containing protein [Candidatus Dormibacteraeota bacterium]|nr:winged helix-turn-helix domain-containing protein [Candidatus Dormibacteraeota bacterium]